jgi:two-component system response regulator PilR (NtrC family)
LQKNELLNNINKVKIIDDEVDEIDYIIGKSSKIKEIIRISKKVAKSNVSVLITGESGTGKELIAKLIHEFSDRYNKPFLPLNCSALPENLIESELFGYDKGAFTGANRDKDGIFVAANNGTVFLDEIGELPLHVQPKLLRVLQSQHLKRVGSNFETKIDVRIISATNRELRKEVDENKFRADLFYRLNVINIDLPPLRERKEDIIPLTNHFIKKFSLKFNTSINGITDELKNYLLSYAWPGNIRELENLIEKLITLESNDFLSTKYIEEVSLNKVTKTSYEVKNDLDVQNEIIFPIDLDKIIEDIEIKYIKAALEETNGKKQEAAKLLGMTFRSFRYRISKHNLDKEE